MNSRQGNEDDSIKLVRSFYDRFPFPPDPLREGPPPGYNWRWCLDAAYAFCTGSSCLSKRTSDYPRILDAGCGSGVSTNYLAHLNPGSEILAVDVSNGAIDVAKRRLSLSGAYKRSKVFIENRNILDLEDQLPFDYINSVGVLHHLKYPKKVLKVLASLLKKGGLLHLFLYADGGRWAAQRVQKSLKLLDIR